MGVKFSLFLSVAAVIAEGFKIATCSPQAIGSVFKEAVDILIVDSLTKHLDYNVYQCNGKTVLSKVAAESFECRKYLHAIKYKTFTLVMAPYALPPETTLSTPNVYTVKGKFIRVLSDFPPIPNRRRLADLSGACKDLTLLWEPKYINIPIDAKAGYRPRFLFTSNIDDFDLIPCELVPSNGEALWDQILQGFKEPPEQSLKAISISTTENRLADIQILQSTNHLNEGCQVISGKWISLKTRNGNIVKSVECRQSRINPRDQFGAKQFITLSAIISVPDSSELVHLYVTVWNPFTVQRSKFFCLEDKQKFKSLTIILPLNDVVASEVAKYTELVVNQHLPLLTPVSSDSNYFVFASKNTWDRVNLSNGLIQLSLMDLEAHKLTNQIAIEEEDELDSSNFISLFCVGLFFLLSVISAIAIWLNKKTH